MPSPRPKVPPYLLMLVVSFALLGLIGYQTLKDRKVSGDLLKKKDSLLLEKQFDAHKLEQLLQKEKKRSSDLQEKFEKLSFQKDKLNGLKDGLSGQLIELERVKQLTEEGKKKLESSLLDRENEVKDLKEKLTLATEKEEKLKVLKKEIAEKDTEINDLKAQIKALGGQVSEKVSAESTNASPTPHDEVEGKEEKVSKQESNAGKGIGKKASEVDEDRENPKVEETADKHGEEQTKTAKKTSSQSIDIEDEESHTTPKAIHFYRVDDREDILPTDDTGEEADAEKTHEEEEPDEQPDVDMDAVNKTDLDENDLAAME